MHQAGKVGGDQILRTRCQSMFYFLLRHANRDWFKFYSKGATETTAGFHIFHFNNLQSFYVGKQLAGLIFYFAFPQPGTGIVVSGFAI